MANYAGGVRKKLEDEYHIQQLLGRILPSIKSDCFLVTKGATDGDGQIKNEDGSTTIPLNRIQINFLISRGYVDAAQGQGEKLRHGYREFYIHQFTRKALRLAKGGAAP